MYNKSKLHVLVKKSNFCERNKRFWEKRLDSLKSMLPDNVID